MKSVKNDAKIFYNIGMVAWHFSLKTIFYKNKAVDIRIRLFLIELIL
jgi:hypothetical protein